MACPYCNKNQSETISETVLADSVRRRRQCLQCGIVFTTYEKVHGVSLVVLKRSGRREPFSINKLRDSLETALRKRLPSTSMMDNLIWEIEGKILRLGATEVGTARIHHTCADALRRLDRVAYLRYTASVDKQTQPIDQDSANFPSQIQLRLPLNLDGKSRSPSLIDR